MENLYEKVMENGYHIARQYSYTQQPGSKKGSLPWLDLRVFYLRISKCEIDSSTPEYLTLNHVPLNHNSHLELNGSIYSDGVSNLLRRDRIDKKSEEVTFVCTDTIRVSGSVKFEVADDDVRVLSGALKFCTSNCNGFSGESRIVGPSWIMSCKTDMVPGAGFLKGSPAIEVYVAGSFSGSPFILTKTLQLGQRRKPMRKAMLESIPENEATEDQQDASFGVQLQVADHQEYKAENEDYMMNHYQVEYLDGEDEELSWFNAGVRVGVGIGLSICVGLGLGVGLLVKTYQGTTRNVLRRLL